MREEFKEAKTKLSEVQGDGQNHSVRPMRGGGMGRENEQGLHEVRRDWVPIEKPVLHGNAYRFYIGAIAVGLAAGISWAGALAKLVRHPYDDEICYGVVAALLAWQGTYLFYEHKRLKRMQAEIDKSWAELKVKYPEYPWDEVRPKV